MKSKIIKACELRDNKILKLIPNNKPGYYKWWMTHNDLNCIIGKLNIESECIYNDMETKVIDNKKFYCIYVGIAVKESIMKRLDWHINQVHTLVQVKYRTLSTLRQSISSLIGSDMMDKEATNKCIDSLYVEYFLSDNEIKSNEAKMEMQNIEKALLNSKYLYLLNIQGNKHLKKQCKKLKTIRKQARERAIYNF